MKENFSRAKVEIFSKNLREFLVARITGERCIHEAFFICEGTSFELSNVRFLDVHSVSLKRGTRALLNEQR